MNSPFTPSVASDTSPMKPITELYRQESSACHTQAALLSRLNWINAWILNKVTGSSEVPKSKNGGPMFLKALHHETDDLEDNLHRLMKTKTDHMAKSRARKYKLKCVRYESRLKKLLKKHKELESHHKQMETNYIEKCNELVAMAENVPDAFDYPIISP